MNITPEVRPALRRLGQLACAATLACGAAVAQAGVATLTVDAFVVTSTSGFVFNVDAFQHFDSTALDAGGLGGSAPPASHTANDWNQGPNVSAATSFASSNGFLVQFVSDFGLITPGFNLAAWSQEGGAFPPSPPNYASALSNLAGAFTLIDFDGNPVEGDITFQVYYTMGVSATTNDPLNTYSQTQIDVLAADSDESFAPLAESLLSSNFANGSSGDVSGFFEWTFNLAAGDWAFFTLTGSAISSSRVPEPGALALAALALAGAGAQRRRKVRRAAEPAGPALAA